MFKDEFPATYRAAMTAQRRRQQMGQAWPEISVLDPSDGDSARSEMAHVVRSSVNGVIAGQPLRLSFEIPEPDRGAIDIRIRRHPQVRSLTATITLGRAGEDCSLQVVEP